MSDTDTISPRDRLKVHIDDLDTHAEQHALDGNDLLAGTCTLAHEIALDYFNGEINREAASRELRRHLTTARRNLLDHPDFERVCDVFTDTARYIFEAARP